MPLTGGNFAIAGYQFDENFQLPSTTLNTNDIASSVDLYGGNQAELKAYTPSKIVSYNDGSEDYTVFAAESKTRQITLYFYDSEGNLDGLNQIGFFAPFTFSSIKTTSDNSLTVLGTSFVAGRFERVTLSRISQQEIGGILR